MLRSLNSALGCKEIRFTEQGVVCMRKWARQTGIKKTRGPRKCRMLKNQGQGIIEYAIVVALILAAMVAMSTYVFRSVQATQQTISQEFSKD